MMKIGTKTPVLDGLDFVLPPELEATAPPEARGLTRDGVRLMVSYRQNNHIDHTTFRNIIDYLNPGDVLVVNTSGTMKAALDATRSDGVHLRIHVSTRLPANLWIVEVRLPQSDTTQPFFDATSGDVFTLAGGGHVRLLTPHAAEQRHDEADNVRLWIATFDIPCNIPAYLERYGMPIRYNYVRESWPSSYYQTVYATEMGSAEMPSAGRAFTPEVITALVAKGVQVVPLLLHTGVASQESHELPYEEYYRVPSHTAWTINAARRTGGRIIAVGTTVVRALETVTADAVTHAGDGWTGLFITPERGIHAVDAMLTGLHEPRATHLAMLEALASREHLQLTYAAALQGCYLWHEFGDLHLILP